MENIKIPYPELSKEIWYRNYQAPGETSLEETWQRLAKACAKIEKPEIREKIEKEFLSILTDFKFIPGGRIMANLGVEGREATTLMNCFVHEVKDVGLKDPDSLEGIIDQLKAQALTLRSEGGYGTNFSWIRPKGSYVKGIGSRTPGVLKFMELWDKSSEIITMGSDLILGEKKNQEKITQRKGAQMAVLSVWHPEIEDFIIAKQTPNRLTKFNMSVGITSGFMEAVRKDKDWDLIFPDTEDPNYENWNGDVSAWTGKIIVYKTVKAKDLWDKIMKATYNRNEPGVLFLDLANKLNPLYYAEVVLSSNPYINHAA